MVMAISSNFTNSTQCTGPLLPMSLGPGTMSGFDATSFCLSPCCVPCPPQGDTFFPQYVSFFKALDIINFVSLALVVLYCLLWIAILYPYPKLRLRSRYVIGTAVALVFWHLPGFITLVAKPKNVLCSNPITRATESTHLCALQGFLYVFSTHAVVIWGGLRIAYVHLQMKKSSLFYLQHDVLINNLIAWGIPIVFAIVALACGQIGYVTSHYCGPALDKGQALLWIPLLVYISVASLLQIWTLIEIEKTVRKSFGNNNDHGRNSSVSSPVSETFENVSDTNTNFGARSEITHISIDGAGPKSEVTESSNVILGSDIASSSSARHSRLELFDNSGSSLRCSRSSRRTTISLNNGLINPSGHFSQTLKDRARFVWELCKLNYRMLISLTLTSFVAIFISVNSLLFQRSIYNLPDPTQAFAKWMRCVQTEGNSLDKCSLMAFELFPLSFSRDVTADLARALFGTIFFIVEITKGYELMADEVKSSDVWRAFKERHPIASRLVYGLQHPAPENTSNHDRDERTQRNTFLPLTLGPALFSKIRLSSLHRQRRNTQKDGPTTSPESSVRQNDLRMTHLHTIPCTQHSLTCVPRAYLHNPQRELKIDVAADPLRCTSRPLTPNTTINSGPVGSGSSTATSARTSLISVVTDSLALGNLLESALSESYSECT